MRIFILSALICLASAAHADLGSFIDDIDQKAGGLDSGKTKKRETQILETKPVNSHGVNLKRLYSQAYDEVSSKTSPNSADFRKLTNNRFNTLVTDQILAHFDRLRGKINRGDENAKNELISILNKYDQQLHADFRSISDIQLSNLYALMAEIEIISKSLYKERLLKYAKKSLKYNNNSALAHLQMAEANYFNDNYAKSIEFVTKSLSMNAPKLKKRSRITRIYAAGNLDRDTKIKYFIEDGGWLVSNHPSGFAYYILGSGYLYSYEKNQNKPHLAQSIENLRKAKEANYSKAQEKLSIAVKYLNKSPETNNAFAEMTISKEPNYTSRINKHINDIRMGVITVVTKTGHGSGFFISQNGLALTNYHVVNDQKFIKVKVTTGREIIGEVIRRDKHRDIALIKVEEEMMPCLPISALEPNIGADVFAIGSPLKQTYSTTITKGILSAYRNYNNLKFIQSDVNILPGNSGGPLLDESGNVIGVAVSGVTIKDSPTGLNFFIPIKEALNTLNIKVNTPD